MASKYNNLTRLYRVNIQRKNSVSRKPARRTAQPATQPDPSLTVPPVAAVASTTQR